jgi:Family of unknown function (DUF5412)
VKLITLALILLTISCEEKAAIHIIQKIESPNKGTVATVFNIEGDATTPFNVHVFLGGHDGDDLSLGGNIFRGVHSEKAVVTWTDNQNLVITTDANDLLLMRRIYDINIHLKSLPPPATGPTNQP